MLVWKQEGTVCYSVRYVFDGHRMYVSGDLGEALFCFTEKSDVHIQSQYDIDYFEQKLRAYHGEKRDFDVKVAMIGLRDWLKRMKENDVKYDHVLMREFFDEARACSSAHDWAQVINSHAFISNLDHDFWDWMYGVGNVMPLRLQSYLIGLKMASEQLKLEERK